MKLIIQHNRIAAVATDEYVGPELWINAPDGFNPDTANYYQYVDGIVSVRIPPVVSRFQARAALHLAGLLPSIEDLMNAPSTNTIAKLAWQDAIEFRRDSPTILAMGNALGLTPLQLDELFITAAGIVA